MGEAYGKVMTYLNANSIEMQGSPISINISYDEQNAEMICAIPVAEVMEVGVELVSGQTYAGITMTLGMHMKTLMRISLIISLSGTDNHGRSISATQCLNQTPVNG